MRLVLTAVLLTITVEAVFSSGRPIHSAIFKPGEQYVYHYKGQILSGVPKSSKQFSGLIIDSLVLLQFQQDYKVIMKLENIKLSMINNDIRTLPTEILSESEVTLLTGEQRNLLVEKLTKPIKFRYVQGDVRQLERELRDPSWSVNIKKGILSLFQVTLKSKDIQASTSAFLYDPLMSRIRTYGSRNAASSSPQWRLANGKNSVFSAMETDVTGNCETKYTIISDRSSRSSSSSLMFVSAVRNFDNCATKPFYIQGIIQGVPSSKTETPLVQPVVKTDYVISGDLSHFLIREATLRGKYLLLVNGLEGMDASAYIVQTLILKQTQPIRNTIRLDTSKVDRQGLQMIIPKASWLSEKENFVNDYRRTERKYKFDKSFGVKVNNNDDSDDNDDADNDDDDDDNDKFEKSVDISSPVEQKLEALIQCLYSPMAEKKCSNYLIELLSILREASKAQLQTVYSLYVIHDTSSQSDSQYRKREILLDILPTLTSSASGEFLAKLIREDRISELRASLLLNTLSLVAKPTPNVINAVLELFKELPKKTTSTALTGKAMLRQATLLAVGTLTSRLLVVMRSEGKPVPQLITFIDSVSMELKRMLEETSSESEKILILKAMGNMGASENIMVLKNIVEDRRQSLKVRVSAVFGLRRSAKKFQKQIIPTLMGVFMDVKEIRELRQAAFVVILKANPSYTTLQMIVHRLRHEPSSQIRTLVYSNLVNLAFYTSNQPEHKTLSKDARRILKTMAPISVGAYDSITILLNKFNEEYDFGAALDITKIKSLRSGLPGAIIANIQGTLFGKHRSLLEVGVEGKSIEGILRKIFGPHGLLKNILKWKVSLQDIFKPLIKPDMGDVEHKIREILNAMMLELRPEEKPFVSWYFRILDNELQYIILNSENIEQIVNKIEETVTELLIKLSEGLKIDIVKSGSNLASLTLASPLGVPLHINCSSVFLLKLEGKAKINALPTFSSIMNGFLSGSPDVGFELNLKPVVEVAHFATMDVAMRWILSGVGSVAHFKTTQPIKVKAMISIPRHTASLKYFVPQEVTKIAQMKLMPFTFVSYIPSETDKLPFIKEVKELKNNDIMTSSPFQYDYEGTITGLSYQVEGQLSRCLISSCPALPLFATQEIVLLSRPVINVEYVELKIDSLKTNFQFEGIPATQSTVKLYEDENSEQENYRKEIRHSEISSQFEPVMVDEIFGGEVPIKRELRMAIRPSNRQLPEIRGLVAWYMASNYWVNQFNVQFARAQFQNIPSWKIDISKVVNPLAWYPDQTSDGQRGQYLVKSRFTFNNNGRDYTVQLKITPGSPFNFTQELKQHVLLLVDGLPEAEVNKYKYTLQLDFPEVRNYQVIKLLTTVQDAIKYHLYNKLTSVIPHEPRSNKFIISVELMPYWEKMNFIVRSPREDMYISDVPFYWNPFLSTNEKVKLHNTYSWNQYKPMWFHRLEESFNIAPSLSTDILRNTECKINYVKHFVTTFDGVAYSIDESVRSKMRQNNCGGVLFAQDCSHQGLFTWYGMARSQDSWTTALLLPKAHIELYTSPSRRYISVNGEEIKISTSESYNIPAEAGESALYVIEKPSAGVLSIKANELGFTLFLNPREHTASLELSATSMLEGDLCGLCGNNNKDPSDDLLVPDNHKVQSSLSHIASNVIPSPTCNVENLKVTNEHCKKTTQLTIRRYDNDVPMTCRSEREVIQCAKGCRPAQTRSVKTCFRCQSESGQSLTRRTYYQPTSVLELEDSSLTCEEFSERLELPTTCIPAY